MSDKPQNSILTSVRFSFFLALALLSRLPLPKSAFGSTQDSKITTKEKSYSVLFYPVVGLIIATLIALIATALSKYTSLSPLLVSALALVSWVWATGALHLDGLADCTDAACSSHKDSSFTLEVFKDPRCGAMAIVSVCLALLLKLACIEQLLSTSSNLWLTLLVSCGLARLTVAGFMSTTHYVRDEGMASGIDIAIIKKPLIFVFVLAFFICVLALSFWISVALFLSLLIVAYFWRRYWMSKIHGYVGDCAGALIEICEIVVLLFLCNLSSVVGK